VGFVVDKMAPDRFSFGIDFTLFVIISQMSHIHSPIWGRDSGPIEVAGMGDSFTHPNINHSSSSRRRSNDGGGGDDDDDNNNNTSNVVVSCLVWSNYSCMGRPGFFSGVDILSCGLCLHVLTPALIAVLKH
jgi:hypothetical protein